MKAVFLERKIMRLHVKFDGKDPTKTEVIDSESGEQIQGIRSVEISIDAFKGYAVLVLQDFSLEIDDIEAEPVLEGHEEAIE